MTPEQAEQLRAKFDEKVIGKLPRNTCRECSDSRSGVCDKHEKKRCDECGNYMTTAHLHLDYVGHAAVTDRLLQIDPEWRWAPVATDPNTGAPLKTDGGLWITLTICGTTRYGWGDGKSIKECIGDAIRNAAMRFGVALDLWAKEDLHAAPPVNPADAAEIVTLMAALDAIKPKDLRTEAKIKFKQAYGHPDSLTASQMPGALALVTEYEQKARGEADDEAGSPDAADAALLTSDPEGEHPASPEADVSDAGDAPGDEPDGDAPPDEEAPERPDVKALSHELGVPESVALALARDIAKARGVKKPVMLKDTPPDIDEALVEALYHWKAQSDAEAEAAEG